MRLTSPSVLPLNNNDQQEEEEEVEVDEEEEWPRVVLILDTKH